MQAGRQAGRQAGGQAGRQAGRSPGNFYLLYIITFHFTVNIHLCRMKVPVERQNGGCGIDPPYLCR